MSREKCFIIAEVGVNHNGSVETAKRLIDVAHSAGADAVKFQTFQAADLVTKEAKKANYQKENTGTDESQFEMLKQLELTETDFSAIKKYCQLKGIQFLSTPFGENAVDILDRIGVDAFKVSSGDLTHLPLLQHIATKNKPVILSTGMADLSEIENALSAIREVADVDISILHCVSDYPAEPADCNLAAIDTLRTAFGVDVGWSDHTLGCAITWAAVARGASIIEKHITLDKNMPGPDHRASVDPAEFEELVNGIRKIEAAIGDGRKKPTATEENAALTARRSLTVNRDMKRGEVLSEADILMVRPGTGLAPRYKDFVLGLRLAKDVAKATQLRLDHFHETKS